jgi:glyoxylase-like metal-dependent hydrolase (beta-lactamase superfamily II)
MPHQAAHMTELGHGIVAVDTDYFRPLQDASHLIVAGDRAAFVDTGTNHSVDLLLDALARLNLDVGQVDFVFLTHVHLDHAGGAGRLMGRLPNAKAVVHPRRPQTTAALDEEKAATLIKLIAALDDDDDVQAVYSNFEVSDDVLEKLTAA